MDDVTNVVRDVTNVVRGVEIVQNSVGKSQAQHLKWCGAPHAGSGRAQHS
jgi:hypothetical protein